MAVCKLAVLSFKHNEDLGGYSIGDLKDCIGMAQENLRNGLDHVAYVPVDIKCFIKWAKHKIKEKEREQGLRLALQTSWHYAMILAGK